MIGGAYLLAAIAFPLLLLLGAIAAVVLLWPAYVLGGADRRRVLRLLGRSALLSLILLVCTAALSFVQTSAGPLGGTLWLLTTSLLVVVPVLGLVMLAIAEPWPMRREGALLVGGMGLLVGMFAVIVLGTTLHTSLPPGMIWTYPFALVVIGGVYIDAFARRREFKRYLARRCPACADPLPPDPREPCARCRSAKRRLCHRCRRFSDRLAGEACPACKATLGARCWRCLYPVAGLDTDRCPECGVWAEPAPERASEPAPAGADESAGTAPD